MKKNKPEPIQDIDERLSEFNQMVVKMIKEHPDKKNLPFKAGIDGSQISRFIKDENPTQDVKWFTMYRLLYALTDSPPQLVSQECVKALHILKVIKDILLLTE